MMTNNNIYENVIDFESHMTDGIYTLPSDNKRFEWRKMIEKVKELGRPLTNEEYEKYRIK